MDERCCICFEDVKNSEDEVRGCSRHKYHRNCFVTWYFIRSKFDPEKSKCLLCQTPLKMDKEFIKETRAYIDNDYIEKIRRDDVIGLMKMVELKDNVFFNEDLIRRCSLCGAIKTLISMKRLKREYLFGHVVEIKLLIEFFKNRNFLRTCWILGDFTLDPNVEYSDVEVMNMLIANFHFDEAMKIMINLHTRFGTEDSIKFTETLYYSCRNGFLPCIENDDSPFTVAERIAGYINPGECIFICNVLPELTRKLYTQFRENDRLVLVNILGRKCGNCKNYHFWDMIYWTMVRNDLKFFEYLWNMPEIKRPFSRSYDELARTIAKTNHFKFYRNFFAGQNILESPKKWNIICKKYEKKMKP